MIKNKQNPTAYSCSCHPETKGPLADENKKSLSYCSSLPFRVKSLPWKSWECLPVCLFRSKRRRCQGNREEGRICLRAPKQVDECDRVFGSLRKLPDAFNKSTCFNLSKKNGFFYMSFLLGFMEYILFLQSFWCLFFKIATYPNRLCLLPGQ